MSLRFDAASGIGTLEPAREAGSDRFRFRCPECGAKAFSAGSDLLCPAEGRRLGGCEGVLPLMRAERSRSARALSRRLSQDPKNRGMGRRRRLLPQPSLHVRRPKPRRLEDPRSKLSRSAPSHHPAVSRSEAGGRVGQARASHPGGRRRKRLVLVAHGAGGALRPRDRHLSRRGRRSRCRFPIRPAGVTHGDRLTRARAEMEDLPLEDAQFDLVVANGSLHYAGRIRDAVSEAHRVLRPGGVFLVLDSPVYDESEPGLEMVRRRKEHHRALGISDSAATAGFLVGGDFLALSSGFGFQAEVQYPFEGVRRGLRRAYCRLRSLAPPARFPLFALEKR